MNGNLAYQEEWPEELIGGKIVVMAPTSINHTFVSGNIYCIFRDYLEGKSCVPILGGAKVFLTDEDRFVPDFMVVCDQSKIEESGVHGVPDLVVEVLSHSTAKNDKVHKKDVYGRCGVREYWLVGPSEKSVEVYRNNGSELVLHDVYTLYPDWALAEMSEEARAAVETGFKCGLYDDLEISLEDIFYRTF